MDGVYERGRTKSLVLQRTDVWQGYIMAQQNGIHGYMQISQTYAKHKVVNYPTILKFEAENISKKKYDVKFYWLNIVTAD